MSWTFAQLKPVLKKYYLWLIPAAIVFIGVTVLFGLYLGAGWSTVLLSAALVLVTFVLAWWTWRLALANEGLAKHQVRAETRNALDKAKLFIMIDRDEFRHALVTHKDSVLDAIEDMASCVNAVRSPTRDDLQRFAGRIDQVKVSEAKPDETDLVNSLVKLQDAMAHEMDEMRSTLIRNAK